MMNTQHIVLGFVFCSFITVAGLLHANVGQPSSQSVLNQIEVLERAVNNSSVTRTHSPEQQQQLLTLIREAKVLYLTGHYTTANYQLEQAGRELYPMQPAQGIPLGGLKQLQWSEQMARVISAIIPVAEEIADEKGMGREFIEHSAALYQLGRDALAKGDLQEAERQLTVSYNALQSAVLMLRSGDRLVITQPQPGSEAAWNEAVRRYQDWRYFADWMAQTSTELSIDSEWVQRGSIAADGLYLQAKSKADQGQWLQAMAQIDLAYLTLEKHWRQAGIDI